jgi:hypothetical protein
MTDVTTGEMPAELVPGPLVPDIAPPEPDVPADDGLRHGGANSLRQQILDHLEDTTEAGPQSVADILQAMPAGITRNSLESAIKRCFDRGEIARISPGLYVLTPQKPVEPPKPAPEPEPDPVAGDGMTEKEWFDALERWAADHSTWDPQKLGPRPNEPGNRIPVEIRQRFSDRLRKREERRRDREAALARQDQADRELRDRLLEACHGNFVPGPSIDDVSPIRAAMELVPLDRIILTAIRGKVDPRLSLPSPAPLATWRNPDLLKKIAELYCRFILVPSMVDAWSKAGKAQGKPVERAEPSPAIRE